MRGAKHLYSLTLAVLLVVLFSGCVSHKLFVDLSVDKPVEYRLESDQIDMSDGYLPRPDKKFWVFQDSVLQDTTTVVYSYLSAKNDYAELPFGCGDRCAIIQMTRLNGPFLRERKLELLIPSWEIDHTFGDPLDYLSEEGSELRRKDKGDGLNDVERERLNTLMAKATQLAYADRFRNMFRFALKAWEAEHGTLDEGRKAKAFAAADAIVDAKLASVADDDPRTVPLKWDEELNEALLKAALEVTGNDREQLAGIFSRFETNYERWHDLEDEEIELVAVVPGWWKTADADSTAGDTLFWKIDRELFQNSDLVITARATSPAWGIMVLVILLAFGLVDFVVVRALKKRKTKEM